MWTAFVETFRTLKTNFFQTFLSVLGIIIGVGALVAMLSVIDGLENFGADLIKKHTNVENVVLTSNHQRQIDGISVKRDTVAVLTPAILDGMLDSLPDTRYQLMSQEQVMGYDRSGGAHGILLITTSLPTLDPMPDSLLLAGRLLPAATGPQGGAVINHVLARRLSADGEAPTALGEQIVVYGDTLKVVGVIHGGEEDQNKAYLPLPRRLAMEPPVYPRALFLFEDIEGVSDGLAVIERMATRAFPEQVEPVTVIASTNMLEEMREGLLVVRLAMGFLIGIAVVVGGIGVMNVLLMSIKERTAEIGVRKAVGASRGTIIRQFLAESVAISSIGSGFGLVLGFIVATVATTVISYVVPDMQFAAAFSARTLLIVTFLAMLIGILFGTYPARKAAGLDPVEAIRR